MKMHISQRKFIGGAAGGAVVASALASGQTANEQKTSSVKRGSGRCRRGSRTEGDKDTIGQFPSLLGVYHAIVGFTGGCSLGALLEAVIRPWSMALPTGFALLALAGTAAGFLGQRRESRLTDLYCHCFWAAEGVRGTICPNLYIDECVLEKGLHPFFLTAI